MIKTLLVLKNKIQSCTDEQIELNDINQCGNDMLNDDILTVLCGLVKTKKYRTVINMFFQYFMKKPSLLKQFVSAIEQYFFMSYYSYESGFCVEKEFLKEIKEYSDNWTNDNIVFLFFRVLEHMMKIEYNVIHSSTERTFTMCNICLNAHPDVLEYRSIVWSYLDELSNIPVYCTKVSGFLRAYFLRLQGGDTPIIKKELTQIMHLIDKCCNSSNVIDCLSVEHFVVFAQKNNFYETIDSTSFYAFISSDKLKIFHLLSNDNKEHSLRLLNYADWKYIISIIDVCSELEACRDIDRYLNLYEFEIGFSLFFMSVLEHAACYYDVVKYYLKSNCPSQVRVADILDLLFKRHSPDEIWNLIDTIEFSDKNEWQYYYFECLPEGYVIAELTHLYSFLKDEGDIGIKNGSQYFLDKLKKYNSADPKAFIKCCKIIYEKKTYNPFMIIKYFDRLFNTSHISVEELFKLFVDDHSLLEDIYIAVIARSQLADINGECFQALLSRNCNFAEKYIRNFCDRSKFRNFKIYKSFNCIYNMENANNIFISMIHTIIACFHFPFYELRDLFNIIINRSKNKEKSDCLIRYLIQSENDNRMVMECLFDSITKLCNEDRIGYLLLFIDKNPSIDDFKNIPITSLSDSWSGSEVPLIEKKIFFLHELLDVISDYDYLEHEEYISEKLKNMEKQKIHTQLLEILRGY